MSQFMLTILDTGGIQGYVFGTNSLQQNVGASHLVDCATRKWAIEALGAWKHNVVDLDDPDNAFSDKTIESGEIDAEVIYAGGGNLALMFADPKNAIEFTKRLTARVLRDAPGLNLVVEHTEFDWKNDTLGSEEGILQATMQALAKRKAKGVMRSKQLGLGVTAECVFTGLPAVAMDSDGRPVSSEVLAKRNVFKDAHQQLVDLLSLEKFGDPPRDFDQLGQQQNEKSYLAVIHTDGNRMGERVERIRDTYTSANQNRAYVQAMRDFSLSIQRAAMYALRQTVRLLESNISQDKDSNAWHIDHQIMVSGNTLPFRPIVFGGDDVTFVCDGRIGLSITSYYLNELSKQELSDGECLECRAGVAIVPTHYPFARAYALAEDLCYSAKKFIQKQPEGATAMDWHVAFGGAILDLDRIRIREYRVPSGNLLMRPVLIGDQVDKTWRTWENFKRITTQFQNGSLWAGRHNKVKALREALRSGPSEVDNFLKVYEIAELPEGEQLSGNTRQSGWLEHEQQCCYYDSIEMVDLFIPLKENPAEVVA